MTDTQEPDVVELLLDQHNQIRALFAEVSTATGTRKQERFEDLVRLLAVHESAEEEIVHPVVRGLLYEGDRVIKERLDEEHQAKQALAELYDLGIEHPEFAGRFGTLREEVLAHAASEETEEFGYLRTNLSAERLRRMASAVRAAEAVAPTRPHPAAGESAVVNLLAGPPLGVFDRVRDTIRDWRRKDQDG